MYLWKVDKLVDDFKSGEVTQKEQFKYMLLYTLLMTLGSDPILFIGSSYNIYDTISIILKLAVTVWGVYYCYKVNSSQDNKDFIVRFMCIGLPVAIRFFVVIIPIFILGGVLEAEFSVEESDVEIFETTVSQVVVVTIVFASYYLYLAKKIRTVSSKIA
jgi:hypothetical protein